VGQVLEIKRLEGLDVFPFYNIYIYKTMMMQVILAGDRQYMLILFIVKGCHCSDFI